ncbi:MAG: cardiolipin synthase [Microbacteriaceae bacterium]
MQLTSDQVTILWATIAFIIDWVVRIIAIMVVPRNRKPTAGMAWLLAIFFIPFVGIILFLLIGNPKLPKAARAKQARVNAFLRETNQDIEQVTNVKRWPDWFAGLVNLNWTLGGLSIVGGNSAKLHHEYDETITAMAAAIEQATDYVHVQSYIFELDHTTQHFFDALAAAVQRGVKVRLMLDHIATVRSKGGKRTVKAFTDMGAEWSYMLPVQPLKGKYQRPDLRNHRKIMVIDGHLAFSGSLNIIDRSYNKKSNIKRGLKWVELVGEFRGPVVAELDAVFMVDWFLETGEVLPRASRQYDVPAQAENLDCQVLPSGPGFPNENNLKMFLSVIFGAREKVILTSPYFVPDESLMYAISSATQRGVHVELFVSETGDQALVYHAQRSYYEALLRAGVKIWMYKPPYILHSKHVSIDDNVAIIGSSNMDIRSFELNKESTVLVYGESFVSDMRKVEELYRENSRELTLDEWLQQPLRSTTLDNLARLTSALQ